MSVMITLVLASILSIIVGAAVGYYLRHSAARKELKAREDQGDQIIQKARSDAQEIKYKARKEAKAQRKRNRR